jgi:serine/threonine-protein kinase
VEETAPEATDTAPDTIDQNRLVGRTIAGKFLVEKYLGDGAMGVVYLARQLALNKSVALKVMRPQLTADKSFVARFQREAQAASRLDHPSSVRMIDFGEEPDGLLYLAMEYLEGRTLYDVIFQDWPLSNARIVDVLSQALAALAVAHDMGVIHRDLKPENIMILAGKNDEGEPTDVVKVLDFGIAKITESTADTLVAPAASKPGEPRPPARPSQRPAPVGAKPLTTHGMVVGTPEYMSPEQARGEKLDHRSDLYSVGIILYQLLVGRVPFEADGALGVVLKHVTDTPRPPHEIFAGVSPFLEAVCLKALEKDRALRYQSARELRNDLRSALEGRPMGSVPSGPVSAASLQASQSMGRVLSTQPLSVQPTPRPALVQKTPSKVTPLGTEAIPLATKAPSRSRATRLLVAGVIGVAVVGAFFGMRRLGAASQLPPPQASVASEQVEQAKVEPTALASAPASSAIASARAPAPSDPSTDSTERSSAPRARRNGNGALRVAVSDPPVTATALQLPSDPPAATTVASIASPPSPATQTAAPAQTSAPPPPTTAAPQPPFDPTTCHARTSAAATDGSVASKDVHAADYAASAESCFQTALRGTGTPWRGAGKVKVSFDDTAHFKGVSASVAGAPGALVSCLEQSARQNVTLQVRGGDITGEPQITIPVTFTCP